VHKSTDGGGSWSEANSGITNLAMVDWLLPACAPAAIYAATDGGGIFKSTNGGDFWAAANIGYPSHLYVIDLALSPDYANDGTLYASFSWVYVSTDRGGSWTQLGTPTWNRYARVLGVAPGSPRSVLAGTDGESLWRYTSLSPVELVSFEASVTGRRVVLGWTTGWETGALGFHVARSTTQKIEDAVRVSGDLVPAGQHTYAYVDDDALRGILTGWRKRVRAIRTTTDRGRGRAAVPALSWRRTLPTPSHAPPTSRSRSPAPARSASASTMSGRLVRSLLEDETATLGPSTVRWNGTNMDGAAVAAGTYFYRLRFGGTEIERKLQVMR
jgi:hypothetical protein